MRKPKKEEILSMVGTLKKGVRLLSSMVGVTNIDAVFELLADIQNGVIAVGETVESSEPDCGDMIRPLEEYCELLYGAGEEFQEKGEFSSLTLQKLESALGEIEESMRRLPVFHEIVFMPYKASMWDSMESVWLAAKKDERCRCHVVPLPYYEKDGESGRFVLKCELDRFPAYVPVVSWETFHLEKRKADIIYIHNPFDDNNLVTCIHPDFFSSKLLACTERLVYIPYFFTSGVLPDLYNALPSYHYMTDIIVQSEKMKEHIHPLFQDKAAALGSPKFDKIVNGTLSQEVPEEWRHLIRGRKVFFLNTSISAILGLEHRVFQKVEFMIRLFEQREDAVLLWRPHPLMEGTLAAMRPELYEEYRRLKERFQKSGCGILDELGDASVAVSISDVYMGEGSSSMIFYFGVKGKPIYLLDFGAQYIWTEREKFKPVFASYVEKDGILYFVHCRFPALCKMKITTGETELITQIPNEVICRTGMYSGICRVGDSLVMAPGGAQEIASYDMKRKVLKKTAFDNRGGFIDFLLAYSWKDCAVLIPCMNKHIIKFYPNTGEVKYIEGLEEAANQYFTEVPEKIWSTCCRFEDTVYLLCSNAPLVVIYHLDDDRLEPLAVGDTPEDKFGGIACDGRNLWLVSASDRQPRVVYYELESAEAGSIEIEGEDWKAPENTLYCPVAFEDFTVIVPALAPCFLRLDKKTKQITTFSVDFPFQPSERKNDFYNFTESNYCLAIKYSDRELLISVAYDKSLFIIDVYSGACRRIDPWLTQESMDRFVPDTGFGLFADHTDYVCVENSFVTVEDLIDQVTSGSLDIEKECREVYGKISVNLDGTAGEKIHGYMMDRLAR